MDAYKPLIFFKNQTKIIIKYIIHITVKCYGGENIRVHSYIKLHGPSISEALNALDKLAKELPTISKGKISRSLIPSGETILGDHDFAFEWSKDPTERQLKILIFNIDEALGPTGCRYSIATQR